MRRATITIQTILKETGFSHQFLARFIPNPLKPMGWDTRKDKDLRDVSKLYMLTFGNEDYKKFLHFICSEFRRQFTILEELKLMQDMLSEHTRAIVRLERHLKSYSEVITLKEIAGQLDMNAGYLRKQITEKKKDDRGEWSGILKIRNFLTLRMFKTARGQWAANGLDFYNQVRGASFKSKVFYLKK